MAEPATLPYNYPDEFSEISQKSIEKQRDTTSISSKFTDILNSTSVQEIQNKGVTTIGGEILTPSLLNKAKTDNKLKTKLYIDFQKSQDNTVQDPKKPIVAGSTPDYKGVDESLFKGLDQGSEKFKEWMNSIQDRQLVARVFGDESSIPLKGRQLIVNSFKTGDFYDELSRMAKSIPGDILRLPNLAYMGQAAVRAAYHDAKVNEAGAFGLKFGQLMQDTPNLKAWNNMLNKSVVTKDMASRLNGWYKEKYIAEHGEEQYLKDHQVPMVEMVNGNIVFQTDENGQPKYRNKELDANVANDLLDLSYNKLGGTEKAGMFFLTMTPFTAGARTLRTAGDIKILNKMDDLRNNDPAYKGLSNIDILNKYRKDRGFAASTFRKMWQTATFTSDKTRIRDAENISDHVNVLNRYDTDIGELQEKIKDSTEFLDTKKKSLALLNSQVTKGKSLNAEDLANKKTLEKSIFDTENRLKTDQNMLQINRKSRRTYSLKNGNGKYVNPYLVSTVADDVIISAAMGYGPQLLSYAGMDDALDTRWQEMIIGLTSPLVAPKVVGLSIRGTTAIADALSTGGITDTAKLLEGSKFIPLINPGILLTNDEAKFRRILTAYNVSRGREGEAASPSPEELESFKMMSRIYKNMRPEYRERSFQSLLKYNQTMQNFEDQMVRLGLPDDEIAKNMQTLNLSMAEVTGLAPLIAYSNKVGSSFTSSDAVTSIDKLAAISMAQEDKLNGIDLLLGTLKQSLTRETGLDLESNAPLQNMFNYMTTMVDNQRNIMTKQKSMLQEQLDVFINNVGMKEVDSDTIDKIVNLNAMIGGRVLNAKDRAIEINKTYNGLMDSVNKQLDEIKLFSGEMDEKQLKLQVRRVADVMFDLELGRRRALGSRFYKDVDAYASDNNIKVDMTKLITTYLDTADEFKGKPLTTVFGRGSDFFSSLGSPIQKTFNSMASNALNKTYSRQDINELKKSLEFSEILPQGSTDLELALYLKQSQMSKIEAGRLDPANATMVDFFDGTAKEAEDVMRYFKDRALRMSKQTANPKKTAEEITNKHISVIDEIFTEADPTGQLLELQKTARNNYSRVVGEATDMGYVPDVLQNRKNKAGIIRKDRKTILTETEGNYKYKNINQNTPEAPFYNIANFAEKLLYAKNDVEVGDLLTSIGNEKNRLFSFLGATQAKDKNGITQYAFDLREPRQEKIMQMAEGLVNTIVTHRLGHSVADEAGKIKSIVKGANGKKLENLDNLNPDNYNFASAMNIIKMEDRMTIPVINKDGTLEQRKFFNGTAVKGFATDIVEHMRISQKARDEFVKLRDEIMDTKGALNIEAKGKLDEQNKAIDALDGITDYVKNPKKFFAEHFENATPESINELIEDLASKGKYMDTPVSERQIRDSLKFMYLKGVLETSAVKKSINILSDTPDAIAARSEITDIQSFVNIVIDKKNKDVMQAIMGVDSEHIGFLEDVANWITYAGGNPRGFAPRGDTRGLTIDNIFSRVFNIARGMVSPLYVGTEIATRLLLEKNQSLLTVALRDKQASKILAKMVQDPEGMSDRDIKTLGQRLKVYITMEVIQNRQRGLPTLNEFVGLDEEEKVQVESGQELDDVKLGQKYNLQGVN